MSKQIVPNPDVPLPFERPGADADAKTHPEYTAELREMCDLQSYLQGAFR